MLETINRVTLMGFVCKAPDIQRISDHQLMCNLTIATKERWKTKDGTQKERDDYHQVTLVDKAACEFAERAVTPGKLVFVEGKLRTSMKERPNGTKEYKTNIFVGKSDGGRFTLLTPKDLQK